MKHIAITALLGLLCAASTEAQADRKQRVREDVLEKQRMMREGKLVRANVRVTVRLKNGSRMRGVVKHGRFIEKLDNDVEFVEAQKPGPHAGLRLWYYDNTDSYIFLPYRSIKQYKIGEKLTDAEVDAIAKRIAASRAKSEKARQQEQSRKAAERARTAKGNTKGSQQPAKPQAETDFKSQLTAAQKKLLEEFPPDAGWGLDKLQELERRKVNIGVYPNEHEAKFIENFGAWNEAHEIWLAEKELAKIQSEAAQKPVETPTKKPPAPVRSPRVPTPELPGLPTPK